MNEADIQSLAEQFAELGLDREASIELARAVQREIDAATVPLMRQINALAADLARYQTSMLLRKF